MLGKIRAGMPDKVLQNMFVICTMCSSRLDCNTDQSGLKKELGLKPGTNVEFLYVQNNAFKSNPYALDSKDKETIASSWKICKQVSHFIPTLQLSIIIFIVLLFACLS